MSLPLWMEPTVSMSREVRQVIESNAQMVGATPEMVEFYRRQPLGLLAERSTRAIVKAAYSNLAANPEQTVVLWLAGEGGGVGKTTRASRVLAEGAFNPDFIGRFMDQSGGYTPRMRYIAMTTVGQDLQKEFGPDGMPIVENTAPNWTADNLLSIRKRLEGTVALAATNVFQEMSKRENPDAKEATMLVVEDLTGFAGTRQFKVTNNHYGIWVLTNSAAQDRASEQRRSNEDPSVELGEVYRANGGVVIDKPSFNGTDALDYMGNDASRWRAFERMNGILTNPDVYDYIISKGIRTYNISDLRDPDQRRFRDTVVLAEFYRKRLLDMGFRRGNAAVVDNKYTAGLPYNLNLIRELKVNSTAVQKFMAS